jgi:hypothetical protein
LTQSLFRLFQLALVERLFDLGLERAGHGFFVLGAAELGTVFRSGLFFLRAGFLLAGLSQVDDIGRHRGFSVLLAEGIERHDGAAGGFCLGLALGLFDGDDLDLRGLLFRIGGDLGAAFGLLGEADVEFEFEIH